MIIATKRTFLALFVLVFTGCQFLPFGKKEAEPIFVGEPETIIVEPPDDASSLSYDWRILDVPDESLLIPEFSATSNVFTFTADIEGEYTFSAIVKSGGEEVADHVFRYIAIEDTSVVPRQDEPMASTPAMPVVPPVNPAAQNLQQLGVAGASASASSRSAETKAASKPKAPARAKPKPRKVPEGVVGGHFTIQVSSWNTAKKAQRVKQSLDGLGYDAYIQRVWIEELNAVWWRVRLGDFSDVQEARRVKDELAGQFADIWVDNMRKEMVETD